MKYTEILKFVLLAFLCLAFFACSSDDDKMKFYDGSDDSSNRIKKLEITTRQGESSIWVKGGDNDYSATSSNPEVVEIVMVTSVNQIIYLPKKVGSAVITVKDSKDNAAALTVEVEEGKQVYFMSNSKDHLLITDPDPLADPTIKDAIADDIAENNVTGKNLILLTYKDHKSGSLMIKEDDQENSPTRFEGTFRIEDNGNSSYYLILHYNDEEHRYQRRYRDGSYDKKDLGPINFYLIEDLTNRYKAKYPSSGINKIEYVLNVYTPRY